MKNKTAFTLVWVILSFFQITSLEAQPKLEFSQERGFYKSSFQLYIKSNDPGATIKYTLDGSDPRNSHYAQTSISPAELTIDPYINKGRAITAGVVVRACALSNGDTSKTVTQSYIFLSEVKFQERCFFT